MEAAAFGAIFLLALLGPALYGGSVVLVGNPPAVEAMTDKDPWMLVLTLIGAAGFGAILKLGGQGVWELAFPYGPQSGWRRLPGRDRKDDFRKAVSKSTPPYKDLKYASTELPMAIAVVNPRLSSRGDRIDELLEAGSDKIKEEDLAKKTKALIADDDPHDVPWRAKLTTSSWLDKGLPRSLYSGHEYILAPVYHFYEDAPDPVVQWVRRRYQSFVDALSIAAATLLGVLLGWIFMPGQDLGKQALFSGVLLAFAAVTLVWAAERRRLAREMEAFWFAREAAGANDAPKAVHVAFDDLVTHEPKGAVYHPLHIVVDGQGAEASAKGS